MYLFSQMQLQIRTLTGWWTKVQQYVVNKVLNRIFPYGIIYHPGQLAVIKRSLLSETSLIFLPVLQSSLDTIVIQRLLSYQFGLPTLSVKTSNQPTKISSTWSRFDGAFSNGTFQLVPSSEQLTSDLAWAVQQEVIQSLLEDKNNFLLPLQPYKTNHETVKRWEQCQFLSSLVEVLYSNDSSVMDISIVPMAISYDIKLEDLSESSKKTSILNKLFKGWAFLTKILYPGSKGCGRARIDFDQPFSLLDFMKNTEKNCVKTEEYNTETVTQNLYNHILWNSFNLRRFSACDIYSFAKHNRPNIDLPETFQKVTTDIRAKHRDLTFMGAPNAVVSYASTISNNLYLERNIYNDVIQIYLGEMIISAAICALLKTTAIDCYKGTHAQVIVGSKEDLLEEAKLLLDLVEYEFPLVAPPCKDSNEYFLMESLDNFLGKTFEYLRVGFLNQTTSIP